MKWFTEHPRSVGETYWQHFKFAFTVGTITIGVGVVIITHAIFPALFKDNGSKALADLHLMTIKRTH